MLQYDHHRPAEQQWPPVGQDLKSAEYRASGAEPRERQRQRATG